MILERVEKELKRTLKKKEYFEECGECFELEGEREFDKKGEPLVNGKNAKRVVARKILNIKTGSIWKTCCNPRCLNPSHFDIASKGERVLMHRDRNYWKRRYFFRALGYVPFVRSRLGEKACGLIK